LRRLRVRREGRGLFVIHRRIRNGLINVISK
jgi:hypothetical protein